MSESKEDRYAIAAEKRRMARIFEDQLTLQTVNREVYEKWQKDLEGQDTPSSEAEELIRKQLLGLAYMQIEASRRMQAAYWAEARRAHTEARRLESDLQYTNRTVQRGL